MKLKSITYSGLALIIFIIYVPSASATTGLGGLEHLLYIYAGIAAVGLLGAVAIFLNLISLEYKNRQADSSRIRKIARYVSGIFLILTTPVYIGVLLYTERNTQVYLFVFLYLAVITSLWLPWTTNRRRVYGVVAVLLLLTVFRSSEFISYTKYNLVDNDPLDETVELAEQKHSHFIHLANGRTFRFTKRNGYRSADKEKKFDKNVRLQIEVWPGSEKQNRYRLFGVGKSRAYSDYLQFHPKPLITLPFKTVRIYMNQRVYLGDIELLGEDWHADGRTLQTSVVWQCCDPQWVEELIQHGADPTYISYGSRSMLHYLAQNIPDHENVDKIAKILIRGGALVDARDEWGNTPLLLGVKK